MSRGRGAPLANLGPNSFAYAILIFWLPVLRYKLVQVVPVPTGTVPWYLPTVRYCTSIHWTYSIRVFD